MPLPFRRSTQSVEQVADIVDQVAPGLTGIADQIAAGLTGIAHQIAVGFRPENRAHSANCDV